MTAKAKTLSVPRTIHVSSALGDRERDTLRLALGAATEGAPSGPAPIEMTLYTGGPFMQWWSDLPLVIDLAGLALNQSAPILLGHIRDVCCVLGHGTSAKVVDGKVMIEGVASGAGDGAEVDRTIALAKAGFPFEASIGADPKRIEEVKAGTTVEVNGRSLAGPLYVIRASEHIESSVVLVGADRAGTQTRIAAKAAGDITMAEITVTTGSDPTTTTPPVEASATAAAPQPSDPYQIRAAQHRHIAALEDACKGHSALMLRAIEEKWDVGRAQTEAKLLELQAQRPTMGAPAIHVGGGSVGFDRNVIEAALLLGGKRVPEATILAQYGAKALDDASKRFGRGGAGLQEVILEAAALQGVQARSIRQGNYDQVVKAAFSSHTLSSTLGAVANKTAVQSFLDVDQSWRRLFKVKRANNFQTMTSVRLVAGMKYQKLAPNGTIQSADATEATYTNKVDTRAILFTLSRADVVNDDTGVFNDNLAQMGRGGALALNEHIWTVFLANTGSFFASGNSNYFEGLGTTLQISQLIVAAQKLREMKDEYSNPVNIGGKSFLLVPPALEAMAKTLYVSAEIRDTSSTTKYVTANPFMNTYEPIVSPYLGTALGLTNASQTAWYLIAEPSDVGVVQVAFLDGVETPTVESVDLDASTLGVGVRGYFDFGAALMEPRKGVMSKGAA